jgi:hypothetical protein
MEQVHRMLHLGRDLTMLPTAPLRWLIGGRV